ncbi:hypothetical protein OPV22_025296 [Ensete ventricosum]|uniref:Late embryogenesis abundant protein LEA-2 subgroup domain-containing protein n=1 Tax=Ensete ventricosum TaxID=4639 RepID=A0AAV8QC94_ENSVE|nr:hypothetical protein OPV22_025296 [Ensete ventricosum]
MADRVYPSAKPNPQPPQANNNGGGGGGPPSFPPSKGQTYGSTRQGYRPQPRKLPPPPRRRRGCCCSCCLWLTLIIVAFVFLAAIAAGVFYVIYRPRRPTFEVDGLRLSAFNVSGADQLTSRLELNLTAFNPNRNIVYLYDAASISVFSGGVDVGDGSFPAFIQEAKNATLLAAALSAPGGQTLDSTAVSDLKKKTRLPLEIDVDTKVGVKMGGWKTKKMGIQVRCEGIDVGVPKGKAAPAASSPSAACTVKLRVKIWKWTIP